MGHKDLRLGQNVYILVFYNISLSWLLPLDGFQFNFLLRDCENDLLAGFAILGTTESDFYRGSATGIPRNSSNGDLFTCEDNMLFSPVKISCFLVKAQFHWCLRNYTVVSTHVKAVCLEMLLLV